MTYYGVRSLEKLYLYLRYYDPMQGQLEWCGVIRNIQVTLLTFLEVDKWYMSTLDELYRLSEPNRKIHQDIPRVSLGSV